MTFLFSEAMVPVNRGGGWGEGGFSCALKTTKASPVEDTMK